MVESLDLEERREPEHDGALAEIELQLLLEAAYRAAGHDFREFSPRTLRRRVADRMRGEGVLTISALQDRILHDAHAMAQFVKAMSGPGNRLLSDPGFFRGFRNRVVPLLRTYSFTRVWIPSCVCAEDAYAIALVLHEEGLLDRTMIYATDGSDLAIGEAKAGEFPIVSESEVDRALTATGSTSAISAYCEVGRRSVRFKDELKRNIVFAQHDIVGGSSLNEFHVIVSRGVLGQFNRTLQVRVYGLLVGSLLRLGFLCLGSGESLNATPYEKVFQPVTGTDSIYRRAR